jgi:transposase, IS5 family
MDLLGRINEAVVQQAVSKVEDLPVGAAGGSADTTPEAQDGNETSTQANQGQLIMDASCAPADIRYPTDLSLLNEAREQTEAVIDALYEQVKGKIKKKPRTYRKQARKEYLKIAKQRKVNRNVIQKAIGKQLGYLRRNLGHIDELIGKGALLSQLDKKLYRKLLIISEVFRQQQTMYEQGQSRIDDRIVSISQPHVRPIVRGKARTPVEFGAKFSASCSDGYAFLDHLSWDNFNESGDLQHQVEQFKTRFGHYPESVHADQIYRTSANRKYCQERGIRLSGVPLGKSTAQEEGKEQRQQSLEDAKIRNQIEGKFGQGKRRFSLARVMAKLAATAETAIRASATDRSIALTFLVMNLERRLRQLLFMLLAWLQQCWQWIESLKREQLCAQRKQLVIV